MWLSADVYVLDPCICAHARAEHAQFAARTCLVRIGNAGGQIVWCNCNSFLDRRVGRWP